MEIRLWNLAEPNKTFISQSTANRYFGNENPIGKIISVDKQYNYEVVGIFEDVPTQFTHKI